MGRDPLSDIAPLAGAQAAPLYRLMRTMAGLGFLAEDAEHRFALTPLGEALRSDAPGHARSMVRLIAGPLGWSVLGEFLHSVKTGEAGAERALGQPIFDYLATAPQEATWFNEMMIAFHGGEPPAVAAAYDFSGLGTIVDVGGGTGNLLTTILQANPQLRGVLHDLPHVAAQARELIASRGLADRCTVNEGSFFDALPEGGDAYMLSHIIHDWDEASCIKILTNCRRAMKSEQPAARRRNGDPAGQRLSPRQALRHDHAGVHARRLRTHGQGIRHALREGRFHTDTRRPDRLARQRRRSRARLTRRRPTLLVTVVALPVALIERRDFRAVAATGHRAPAAAVILRRVVEVEDAARILTLP